MRENQIQSGVTGGYSRKKQLSCPMDKFLLSNLISKIWGVIHVSSMRELYKSMCHVFYLPSFLCTFSPLLYTKVYSSILFPGNKIKLHLELWLPNDQENLGIAWVSKSPNLNIIWLGGFCSISWAEGYKTVYNSRRIRMIFNWSPSSLPQTPEWNKTRAKHEKYQQ